jgi:hypothetical protein
MLHCIFVPTMIFIQFLSICLLQKQLNIFLVILMNMQIISVTSITFAGWLEHYTGLYAVLKHMIGYQCKGGKSTLAWEAAMHSLTTAYLSNLDNGEHKTVRSLIGKHMHDLPKSISVSRDQPQFIL